MVDEPSSILGRLTVAQAAERLAVSAREVIRLIGSGDLPADRAGNRTWLIPVEAVERRLEQDPRDGRRLTPPNAWAALFLIIGEAAPWLDQSNRWRIGRWLDAHQPSENRARFAARGRPSPYRAHPSFLTAVREDPLLMLTGTAGAMERRLGLVGGSGEIDAYVSSPDLDAVVARHHLRPSRDPNVVLRVVAPFTTPWPPARIAPASAIALDLLDSPEPRAKQVGEQVLRRIERAYAQRHANQ